MLTICRSYQRPALLAGVLVSLPLLLGQGCPATGGGMPVVVLDFPNLDRSVAVGEQVTVVYDATNATSVRAFYDHDGQANTGDEVVFSGSLPSGTDQVTQLATASLPTGLYYLGVTASNAAGTSVAYAAGRITLVSNATVTFLSPASNINVGPGVQVPIRVNTGLTSYSYRLFYDRDGVFNGNEVKIVEGLSDGTSFIEKQFDTSVLTSGAYYIGVTVTTSVGSSVTAYAPGKVTVVTGVYVQVLAPTVGLRAVAGDAVQVVVAANDPANPNANLRTFYDLDNTFGNGNETTIEIVSQTAGGAIWDTTGVATGDYYVGAELLNGLTPPIVSYSAGPVELASATGGGDGGGDGSGNGVVILRTPASAITVLQGSIFRVSWITTVPRGGATVKVFREPDLNNDGREEVVIGRSDYYDQYAMIFRQLDDGRFEESAKSAGIDHPCAASPILADFDRDGDLDVVLASSRMREWCAKAWDRNEIRFYENDANQYGGWLAVRLVGDGVTANRSAIGARVVIEASGKKLTKVVQGAYGHGGSQQDGVLFFGLGGCTGVDSIEVRWPDQARSVERWEKVGAGRVVELVMGDPKVHEPLPSPS